VGSDFNLIVPILNFLITHFSSDNVFLRLVFLISFPMQESMNYGYTHHSRVAVTFACSPLGFVWQVPERDTRGLGGSPALIKSTWGLELESTQAIAHLADVRKRGLLWPDFLAHRHDIK
jgi:hypothetical protein